MAETYQRSLYKELFNDSVDNDETFYKSIFTTPVYEDLLLGVLRENSEAIALASDVAERNLSILRRIYVSGLAVFKDAIKHESGNSETKDTTGTSTQLPTGKLSLSSDAILDNGGGDITELNGIQLNNCSRQVLPEFDEGDDLTTLNGKDDKNSSKNNSTHSLTSEREFDFLDDKLRAQLIENVIKIFRVWFQNIIDVNYKLRKAKDLTDDNDLCVKVFESSNEKGDMTPLVQLLTELKWFLNIALQRIEESPAGTQFLNLTSIKEAINLLNKILKSFYIGLSYHKSTSDEYNVLKSLLFSFYEIDFSNILLRIIKITNPTAQEEGGYKPAKVVLSVDTLVNLYILLGVLVNIPAIFIPDVQTNSDITTLPTALKNPYRQLFDAEYDWNLFNEEVNLKFLPLFCMEYSYCYKFRPDLMLNKIQNSSLINWISGNRLSSDLYVNCLTTDVITNLQVNNKLTLTNNAEEDLYLKELNDIYEHKLRRLTIRGTDDDSHLEMAKLLPVLINMYTLSQNPSFVKVFTIQRYKFYSDLESKSEDEIEHVELFEVWLCLLSYLFEYQYRSSLMQDLTKLSLATLFNLPMEPLLNFQINEFKWKLCHQKVPFVPLNTDRVGYKASVFYILDAIQNLLRFNLTYKLNVTNLSMGLTMVYNILDLFQKDLTIDLSNYAWEDLHLSLFGLIKFFKKQSLIKSKYVTPEELGGLVEDCLLILNLLLDARFNSVQQDNVEETSTIMSMLGFSTARSISYSLIYNILLNFESIQSLVTTFDLKDSKKLHTLFHCMNYFDGVFYLTEDSKLKAQINKIDVIDFDFDSPEFLSAINAYTNEEHEDASSPVVSEKPNGTSSGYKYKNTLRHSSSATVSDKDMLNIIQNVLSQRY
ncbi:hypothetical protein Cantr_07628 [Candida viswanathii]|uniref:Armadillo-like helical domain-containing protein n=1 Tax=Candida viswanathii TaxID=5486 RepID=A0A367Y0J3_9ASCO|nr:hypothetical protein Cantr_07628 [Candida viswanathii]